MVEVRFTVTMALLTMMLSACGARSTPPPPSPSPSPTPAALLSSAQVRYALIDEFGPLSYCDPDQYPIPHGDEQQKANERLPDIERDAPTFAAILTRLGLAVGDEVDEAATLAVYREWKQLNAMNVTLLGDGRYSFDLVTETDPGMGRGIRSAGSIDGRGVIQLTVQEQTFLTGCPICLARGVMIDTPLGPVVVEALRAGDLVWTVDATGSRVIAPLLSVGSTAVPAGHRVVELALADGRRLFVSPGHELADGRRAGELAVGDEVDGSTVTSAGLIDYSGGRTFDLLPAGETGFYWAEGILLASTLR